MSADDKWPVVSAYHGAPDFWGRYLTNTYYCPALSAAEIAAAQTHHMGILPIYNDYDCSAVRGYQTAGGYAAAAAAAAAADGIPQGRGIDTNAASGRLGQAANITVALSPTPPLPNAGEGRSPKARRSLAARARHRNRR